ncbi:hypothetical protein GWK47_013192 [Chionoecetes opilio]|uniref:Uncharacterized protein n=1 Tax=Chionoecetes opilio TaxID=41210 RepID=A0A8J4XVR5_CHIOP|nr:hypothetical protein GWK47_013192 [Chionoecetes opilio]
MGSRWQVDLASRENPGDAHLTTTKVPSEYSHPYHLTGWEAPGALLESLSILGMAHHSTVARVHVDRKYGLTDKVKNTMEILGKYCLRCTQTVLRHQGFTTGLEDGPKNNPHAAQSDEGAAQRRSKSLDLLVRQEHGSHTPDVVTSR